MKKLLCLLLSLSLLPAMGVTAFAAEFTDILAGADYAEAVAWCRENGLMQGVSAASFSPNGTLTRAMVATVLYRAAGEPAVTGGGSFTDVAAGAWYADAVAWASGEGIIRGYGGGLFGTNDPVTKEQLNVLVRRYNGENPTWTGDPDLKAPATRAEAAQAFYTYLREQDKAAEGKILVAYFSASGNTKDAADAIAAALDADLLELVPETPYTSEDLNWTEPSSRVNAEHTDPAKQDVKLAKSTVDNWADYDVVFIGYPIWWGNAAWPVNDFVKSNDFTGKTVIPFCTSTSSGLGQSGTLLAEMAKGGSWQEGHRFPERASQSDIAAWAEGIDLIQG